MHFALVKKFWGPFFDHFVDLQILTIWASGGYVGPSGPREGKIMKIIQNHCVLHGWRPWATIWPQSGEGDMDQVL